MNLEPLAILPIPTDTTKEHRKAIEARNKLAEKYNADLQAAKALQSRLEDAYSAEGAAPGYALTDRSPAHEAMLECVQQRLTIIEHDHVLNEARRMKFEAAREDYERRGREIVAAIRSRMCIPASVEHVPLSCLENDPAWWQWKGEDLVHHFTETRIGYGGATMSEEAVNLRLAGDTFRSQAAHEKRRAENAKKIASSAAEAHATVSSYSFFNSAVQTARQRARLLFPAK